MERPHFDIVVSGARMRAIRQERKISVKQVMEYMGFESTQAVYKWEAGKCFPHTGFSCHMGRSRCAGRG